MPKDSNLSQTGKFASLVYSPRDLQWAFWRLDAGPSPRHSPSAFIRALIWQLHRLKPEPQRWWTREPMREIVMRCSINAAGSQWMGGWGAGLVLSICVLPRSTLFFRNLQHLSICCSAKPGNMMSHVGIPVSKPGSDLTTCHANGLATVMTFNCGCFQMVTGCRSCLNFVEAERKT